MSDIDDMMRLASRMAWQSSKAACIQRLRYEKCVAEIKSAIVILRDLAHVIEKDSGYDAPSMLRSSAMRAQIFLEEHCGLEKEERE